MLAGAQCELDAAADGDCGRRHAAQHLRSSTRGQEWPRLDGLGFPYDPVLEPTSLDNFALWITVGEQRFPLEATFMRDDAGDYTRFRSRIAVAQRPPPIAAAP